jgi:hypothetical protein
MNVVSSKHFFIYILLFILINDFIYIYFDRCFFCLKTTPSL